MADPLLPRFPRAPYLGAGRLRTLWKGVCISPMFPGMQREGCVAQPVHWVLPLPQPCCRTLRLPGSQWCGPVPNLASLLPDRGGSQGRAQMAGPSSPCPHASLPLQGNGARWDRPARVSGGGLGLCCHSECGEPELGAATQLCPGVKQAGSAHAGGLLLGTGGWHNSSRQPSPDLGRGGERGNLGRKGVRSPTRSP